MEANGSRELCVLAVNEKLRYSQLRKEMYNITNAVLVATLKDLVEDGIAERNHTTVLTVWDGDRLVGLTRVLDDTEMLAQIHYVLVHPE